MEAPSREQWAYVGTNDSVESASVYFSDFTKLDVDKFTYDPASPVPSLAGFDTIIIDFTGIEQPVPSIDTRSISPAARVIALGLDRDDTTSLNAINSSSEVLLVPQADATHAFHEIIRVRMKDNIR